jgi:hypothetical protein
MIRTTPFYISNADYKYIKTTLYKLYMNFKLLLNKQNFTHIELTKKLDILQDNKKYLVNEQNKMLVNIYDDEKYDMIIDIFEYINESYIHNIYGNYTSYITIYNNIIICIEDDTDYNYSNLIFTYNKNNINNNDLELLYNIFKFLIK